MTVECIEHLKLQLQFHLFGHWCVFNNADVLVLESIHAECRRDTGNTAKLIRPAISGCIRIDKGSIDWIAGNVQIEETVDSGIRPLAADNKGID